MKKLLILFLLTLNLFAQTIAHTIPKALEKKLCDQLANNTNRCDNGSTINYHSHLNLNNGKLLVFVYLNEHAVKIYNRPDAVIPIVIDQEGRWISTIGENIISEDIQSIHQDPHGNIWVRTMWHIEGVYPAYYHSREGINWKQTVLPKDRNVDCCFEYVDKPIFLFNSITLTFRNTDNTKVKSWTANYNSAMSNNPIWQPLDKVLQSNIQNIPDNRWKISKSSNKITFLNSFNNKKNFLRLKDNTKKTRYYIQVGAYTQMSSVQKVKKALNKLPYANHIEEGKKYKKLLIGEFTTAKKAKAVLKKLKKDYPKEKVIQKAFVLKSKSY